MIHAINSAGIKTRSFTNNMQYKIDQIPLKITKRTHMQIKRQITRQTYNMKTYGVHQLKMITT